MIRPNKLEPFKLKVRDEGMDTVAVNDRKITAVRVRLTLTGLMENLWQGYYWFRQSDGVFLQHRGVNGLPGTPETVIRLNERISERERGAG